MIVAKVRLAAVAPTKNTGYMRMSEALRRTGGAVRTGARAGATATRSTGGFVHRLTSASGAGRTGLSTLIELTTAAGAGDAFVIVALAGTIFFNTSVDQARGKVVLFLLVTMAPFAVLGPFIGPALDRVQQGRKYLLAGTLLARGLLCYAMSAAVSNPITLLPAAFGILVLQKAYGVVRASVAPRLLPEQITLVTANARSQLIAVIGATVAAGAAEGIQSVGGAAWVLRVGMVVYLGAMVLALRLPDQVDTPLAADQAVAGPAAGQSQAGPQPGHSQAGPGPSAPESRRPGPREHRYGRYGRDRDPAGGPMDPTIPARRDGRGRLRHETMPYETEAYDAPDGEPGSHGRYGPTALPPGAPAPGPWVDEPPAPRNRVRLIPTAAGGGRWAGWGPWWPRR